MSVCFEFVFFFQMDESKIANFGDIECLVELSSEGISIDDLKWTILGQKIKIPNN